MSTLSERESICEVCGCRESQGHVDPLKVDESFKLEGYRAQLRTANNTEAIHNRAMAAANGHEEPRFIVSFGRDGTHIEEIPRKRYPIRDNPQA